MQESYLNSPMMYSIALTLIHFIWQGGLVALALKFALMIVPRQNAQLRYSYSALAMVTNLILPIVTFFIIYKPTYLQLTNELPLAPTSDAALTSLTSVQNEWYSTTFEYLPYVSMVWLTIITILSVKLLIELYSVNQLPNKATISPEPELLARFHGLVDEIGLKKAPKLLLSLSTEVPMAIGWLKPVVLIPVSMLTGLTPAQLDMLILHELAHVRRHDYFVNFIQTIVEIVLFFHPAVLWVSNQMRNEREYCSDDIAVHHCGNPIAYAHTLADTASICNKHRNHSIPSMAMAASGGDLTQRVVRLVNEPHCSSQNNVSKWFASLCVLSVVLFVSSQQLLKLTEVDINTTKYSFNEANTIEDNIIDVEPLKVAEPTTLNTQPNTLDVSLLPKVESDVYYPEIFSTPALTEDPNFNDNIQSTQQTALIDNQENVEIDQLTFQEATPLAASNKSIAPKNITPSTNATTQISSAPELLLEETPAEKSVVELAFEKTDSTRQAPQKNKYVKEIADLSSELQVMNNIKEVQPIASPTPTESFLTQTKKAAEQQTNAKLVVSIAPKYPSTAKRKGIELEVKVDFVIGTDGRVRDIKFHPKNKVNYFRAAVRSAIEKWQFEPAKYNGQAVESNMSKIFSFSLER